MSEQVTAAMVRSHEVMLREQADYDYEKVFWGSLFGVGLVGLGWLSVKLGRVIQAVQDPVGALGSSNAKRIIDFVEGANKDTPVTVAKFGYAPGFPHPTNEDILYFRENPAEYEEWKLQFAESQAERPPEMIALDLADSLLGKYGAVIPAGLVLFNMTKEIIRVRRLKE